MKRTHPATGGLAEATQPRRIGSGGGGTRPAHSWRATALLATASLFALLCQMPRATAQECAAGAPPPDVASPAALYETLLKQTDAQLLAIGFRQRPVAAECAWIYEVKMLTASGSVVELDFAARDLDLIGARGPDNDREVGQLVRGLGGDASTIITGNAKGEGAGHSGGGDDDGGGSEGGEGGHSGSGGGDDGGGEGGSDSGSGGGDDGGGDGGDSGEGGDD